MIQTVPVPDARYQKALTIVRQGGLERLRISDHYVLSYAKFLLNLRRASTEEEVRRLCFLEPVCSQVHILISGDIQAFTPTYTDEKLKSVSNDRAILKALIVSDASTSYISQVTLYSESVVQFFEKLYWDVRQAAKTARAWLVKYLFPDGIQAAISSKDFEKTILYQAYVHGLAGVRDFLHLDGPVVDHEAYIAQATHRNMVDMVQKVGAAVRSVTPTQETSTDIVSSAIAFDKHRKDRILQDDTNHPAASADVLEKKLFTGLQHAMKNFGIANPLLSHQEGPEEKLAVTPRISKEKEPDQVSLPLDR